MRCCSVIAVWLLGAVALSACSLLFDPVETVVDSSIPRDSGVDDPADTTELLDADNDTTHSEDSGFDARTDVGRDIGGDSESDIDMMWLDTQWATRWPITVHSTRLSEVVTDFPVGIAIEGNLELLDCVQPRGVDVVFTRDDGITRLSHEIEEVDRSSGSLFAWVRVPLLATDEDRELFLYCGNPSASDQQDIHGTWRDRFVGVWHFGRKTMVDSVAFADSSPSNNEATAEGFDTRPLPLNGLFGGGLGFDGIDDSLSMGDPDDESLDFDLDSFSLSLWVNVESSAGHFDMPWFKGASNDALAGYDLELGTSNWSAYIGDGVDNRPLNFGDEAAFLEHWVHLALVVNREEEMVRIYAEGALCDESSIATLGSVSTHASAYMSTTSYPFSGVLDEVRIASSALSEAWIDAEHTSLLDPSSFITVGEVQRLP